jgi:hypothetical protein
MMHLWLAVTAHGFGHLAQAAPVVQELARRRPLRLTVQADLPDAFLAERLPAAYRQVRAAPDPGLPMDGPLRTRWAEALAAYAAYVREEAAHLARQQSLFAEDPPDVMVADVPWIPLVAASRMGIAAVGLCSLNWLDILRGSPVGDRLPAGVAESLGAGYAAADLFIRPAPGQPMSWLERLVPVGPIASLGVNRAAELRARLGLPDSARLVLLHFGGIPLDTAMASWPIAEGVHWLVPGAQCPLRPDVSAIEALGMPFVDIVASADLLVTKPGYGAFTEAACHGLPVLYVPRGDWAEEPHLVDWLHQRVPAAAIGLDALLAGRLAGPLARLFAEPRRPGCAPTGAAEAADLIESLSAAG